MTQPTREAPSIPQTLQVTHGSMSEVILIGRAPDPIDDEAERLLGGLIVALQAFDTETLERIAQNRDEINPDGWMQKLIREYVEVWR